MKKNTIILYLLFCLCANFALAQLSATLENDRLTFKQDFVSTTPTTYGWESIQVVGVSDATITNITQSGIDVLSNLVGGAGLSLNLGLTVSDFSTNFSSQLREDQLHLSFSDFNNNTTHNFPFTFFSDNLEMTIDYQATTGAGSLIAPFLFFDGPSKNMAIGKFLGETLTTNLHIQQGNGNALLIENDGSGNDIWGWEVETDDLVIFYDSDGPNLGYNPVMLAFIDEADGSYNATSDRRFKRDITPLADNTLTKVTKMHPVFHHNKKGKKISSTTFGFKAEKIGAIYPELMKKTEDGTPALNLDEFAVVAIKAIQEQYPAYEKQEELIQSMQKEEAALSQSIEDLNKRLEEVAARLK